MPNLSDALDVAGLHLRNRLVMAPMVTGLAVDHAPTEALIQWYRVRVRGGVGLVVVESVAIAPDAKLLPFMMGIWEDGQVAGLARLASAIRAEGVPAVVQIVHGGARSWRDDLAQERVGPSPVALLPGPLPRELSEPELVGIIEAFAQAARRAKEAGFDGVEIHAAHYYLLSEFLSPRTNLRTDRWGQDRAGRARFPLAVVAAVREAVGPGYPIFCRLHGQEAVEGGLTTEDAIFFAQVMAQAGVDVLDISGIGQSSMGEWEGQPFLNTSSVLPKEAPGGSFGEATGRIRAAVKIPVIAVGKLAASGAAQQVLDRGQADLVALARPLIADPRAPEKILAGLDAEVESCRECLACFGAIRKGPIKCSVNKEL
jgi:2,4-dienoyl-CoA reductase-like NADH-dependent reductase (Old Yellow Enzyme family)